MFETRLRIGLIYPQVLGTYGDSGNAVVLKQRAKWRGIDAEVVTVALDETIPSTLDIYVLGGGEDTAQALAAERLRRGSGLQEAAKNQKPILAICAAFQILGMRYTDGTGRQVEGLSLLDAVTEPMGKRAIGELVVKPTIPGLEGLLTGFENHGGATLLGPSARPLGTVMTGVGNNLDAAPGGPSFDGAVQDSIIGTYLHGPVLARNPGLADYLLEKATGLELETLELGTVRRLRRERLAAAGVQEV